MNEDIVAIPVVFGTFVWVCWIIFNTVRRHKAARMQAELQGKLIEKFNSGQDLLAYVQTEAGQTFMSSLAAEQRTPYGRILTAVQSSIVLVFLGAALLFLRHRISGSEEGFLALGTIILSLGVAFAVAAGASYALSKRFGLLEAAKRIS